MTRIGFRVTYHGEPVKDAIVSGNLFPVPFVTTNDNGEVFSIVPTFVSPGRYLVDVTVSWPETNLYKGSSLRILDLADEINSYYKIDVEDGKWSVDRLTGRIGGDGFYAVNQDILIPENLIISDNDSMLSISNCGICLYFDRIGSVCRVNGKLTEPVLISQPFITTSPFYYPFFLSPSIERINRDVNRL